MTNQGHFKFFILSFMVAVQTLFSQITMQGTVIDNGEDYLGNGAEPVANALVTVIDQSDTSRFYSAFTNEQGQYSIQITTMINNHISEKPYNFRLLQNYPNPFYASTVVGYELSQPAHITIEVYNILGRKVKTLLNSLQNGSGQVIWDVTDDLNQRVPSGLYIYSMREGDVRINKMMVLLEDHIYNTTTVPTLTSGTILNDQTALNKTLSDQYTLQVTGENIETYTQQNLEIIGDITLDLKVNRTVTDQDGNVYRTVKIGDQWWMAENLKVTHYRNGEPIPNVTGSSERGGYCAYDNDESNADTYGYLYNWYAVADGRNVAPAGWHVPTDEEWKQLEMYLGMSRSEADGDHWRGTNEGSKLAENASLWNDGGLETNSEFGTSGFSAVPGGFRENNGIYARMGTDANFWCSAEDGSNDAWDRDVYYEYSAVYRNNGDTHRSFSLRCVSD